MRFLQGFFVFAAVALTLGVVASPRSVAGDAGTIGDASVLILFTQFLPPNQTVLDWNAANPPSVSFTNGDPIDHHPISGDHGGSNEGACFDAGVIPGGKSATVAAGCWGQIEYHCHIHPFMTGTLDVPIGPVVSGS